MSKPYDDYIAQEIAEAANDPNFDALALTLASCSDAEAEAIKQREISKAERLKAEVEKAERQRERTYEEQDAKFYDQALDKMSSAEFSAWKREQGVAGQLSDNGTSLSEAWGYSRGDHVRRDDE